MNLTQQVAPEWVRHYVPAVLILAGLVTFGFWLMNFLKSNEQVGQVVIATPSREVRNVPKVSIDIKAPVKVFSGSAALKKKLNLPTPVIENKTTEILASNTVKSDDHPHTVTTTIDSATGESVTYVRTDPYPWLAFDSRGSVGMYYGFKNSQAAVRLQAQQDIVDIKAIRIGAIASVDQYTSSPTAKPADWYVGIGLSYHW